MKWLPCRVFVALSVWAFAASTPPPAFSQTPAFAQTKDIGVLPARVRKEMARGERYALLIGIGRHQDKRIPGLNYSAADAKAMYAVLTDPNHGRFPKKNVRLLLDERATAKGIRRGFTWLRRRAGPEDMAVVYYSGHGAPEEGGTYWVPYDADIDDLEATAVGNAYITRQLRRVRAKRLITFLDSCYSAAIVKKEDRPKALFNQDFFAKFKGAGRVTITASDGKELSLESKDLGQGVFTYYLVQALKGKADVNQDGAVELEEVWAHVRKRVTDEAIRRGNRQRPQLITKSLSAGFLVSLNPGVLPRFRKRQARLLALLQKRRVSGSEYEEARKVLDGEGDNRLLQVVRDLADGRLAPRYYRVARADVLRGNRKRPAQPPAQKPRRRERKPERAASAGTGDLYIVSEPPGARIFIDGRDTGKKTPVLLEGIPSGNRRVRLRKGNYMVASKGVSVPRDDIGQLKLKLEVMRGRLKVVSEPLEADVFVGKKKVGRTPLIASVPGGPQVIRVVKAGYKPFERKMNISVRRSNRLMAVLVVDPIPRGMVKVPVGWFIMGSNESDDEKPRHRVYLDEFFIDKYPVTNARFRRFGTPDKDFGAKFNGARQPVVGVTWTQARDYCKSVEKRLPTEAEWEKSARGVDGRKYPWGSQWDGSKVIWDKNSGGKTHPVDRTYNTHRSPYGAVDMAGNTWEWVADWYGKNYYANAPDRNPKGPASGSGRVLRGGSWGGDMAAGGRAANRGIGRPDDRTNWISFRCAKASNK